MTREELAQYINSELAEDEPEIYFDIDDYKIIVKALEQEPTTKNNLGVDCISRQAVIDEMEKRHTEGDSITKGFIKNMPSVTPIRPKGHWMDIQNYEGICWECSSCKQIVTTKFNYCPNCGAAMREVEEIYEVLNGNND